MIRGDDVVVDGVSADPVIGRVIKVRTDLEHGQEGWMI